MPPWSKYRVGTLESRDRTREEFDSVYHVAHRRQAVQILNDGEIRQNLVFDDSRLNTTRTLVVWLSPNNWDNPGYIYGNVRFKFNWENIINNKLYYWVEAMTDYKPHAPRILITDQVHDDLTQYHPESDDGPWYLETDSGTHYRNGKITLEFLIEEPLSLSDCEAIDPVMHNANHCTNDWKTCKEFGKSAEEIGGLVLCDILSTETATPSLNWVTDEYPSNPLIVAWRGMRDRLRDRIKTIKFTGSIHDDVQRQSVARAMLSALTRSNDQELVSLAKLFESRQILIDSVAQLTAQHFELEDPTRLMRGDFNRP